LGEKKLPVPGDISPARFFRHVLLKHQSYKKKMFKTIMFAILGADRMLLMSYADVLLPIAFKFDPQQSK